MRNASAAHRIAPKKEKSTSSLVFTTKFFKEVKSLKSLVHDMKEDIKRLIGDVRIIFALKKHEAINDYVIKNRSLSIAEGLPNTNFVQHPLNHVVVRNVELVPYYSRVERK